MGALRVMDCRQLLEAGKSKKTNPPQQKTFREKHSMVCLVRSLSDS